MSDDVQASYRELTDSPAKLKEHNDAGRYVVAPGEALTMPGIDRMLPGGYRVEPEYLLVSHDAEDGMVQLSALISAGLIIDREA